MTELAGVNVSMKVVEKLAELGGHLASRCLALYVFYIVQAAEQKTNKIWCPDEYAAKGINLCTSTIIKYRKLLIESGLISMTIQKHKKGRFGKTYIKIKRIKWNSK